VRFAESLCLGKFHSHIRDVFAPQVVRYIDLMESSVAQSVHNGFEKETWQPQGYVRTSATGDNRFSLRSRLYYDVVFVCLSICLFSVVCRLVA